MSQEAWNDQLTEPTGVSTFINFTGAGTAAPVKNVGRGLRLNRTGVGLVSVIWDEFPGVYLGVRGYCYEGTTPSQLRGYTLVTGDYNASSRTLPLNITSNGDALVDLVAGQRLSLTVLFARTGAFR